MIAVIFITVIAVFVVANLLIRDKSFSAKENRALEQRPKISANGLASGRYMNQCEDYMADQFAGRDFWMTTKTRVDLLLGKRESNGIFKGKDGYLLGEIEKSDDERMGQNLEAMKNFSQKHEDIKSYVMLVPNSANILKDKLPRNAVTENQEKQFSDIQKELGEELKWVDMQTTLEKHKEEDIYYKTDHHWTTLGAYYGYKELATVIGLDEAKEPEWKPYAVSVDFNGTSSSTSGYNAREKEAIYIYSTPKVEDNPEVVVNYVDKKEKTATLYDREKLNERDQYAMFLSGNHGQVNIKMDSESTERLLLIKDSYANCLVPFLTPYYREIVIVDPRYYYGDIEQIISENKITQILYLYNGNTFVKDNSIAGVLENIEME